MNTDCAEKVDWLFGQQSSRFPQLREEFLVEREFEVRRSRAAAGAHAHSDHALDKLDVPQPPADDQFVKLSEPLANIDPVAMVRSSL